MDERGSFFLGSHRVGEGEVCVRSRASLWKTEWLFTYPMDIGGDERALTSDSTLTVLDLQSLYATAVF
jgi:hypothetical protein